MRHRSSSLLIAACSSVALLLSPAAGGATPPNDNFADATPIGAFPFTASVAIDGATTEPNEPFVCTFLPQTVWYRYHGPATGVIKVSLSSPLPDAFLQAFHGNSFDSLLADGCMPAAQPAAYFNLQPGIDESFQVGTQSVEGGQIGLTIQAPRQPTNDTISQARALTSLPFDDFVAAGQASWSATDPTDCFSGIDNIWYTFTPQTDIKLGIGQNLGQPGIVVFSGKSGALQLLTCGGLPSIVDVKKGVTYTIEIVDQEPAIDVVFGQAFTITQFPVGRLGIAHALTGSATVTGTVTCSQAATALVHVDLKQTRQIGPVESSVDVPVSCSTTPAQWSVTLVPFAGESYGPGAATVAATASGGGVPPFYNADSTAVNQVVALLPSP